MDGRKRAMEIIEVPKKLAEEAKKRGVDVSALALNYLIEELGLDPEVAVHVELARDFLPTLSHGASMFRSSPLVAEAVFHGSLRGSTVHPRLYAFGLIWRFRAQSH